jgi:hypothetical protein
MTTRYWITSRSGDWSTGADWQSGVVPGSTDGAVIANTSGVTVDGAATTNSLSLDGSSLTVNGTLTLATSLTVIDGARLTLSGGTLSAQSISSNNSGYLFGYGAVSGAVSGGVHVTADGGALQVQGSLAGDEGNFTIDGGASLELSGGGVAPVVFDGGSATFKLDAPAAFTGAIDNVVVGDVIDLAGIVASSATYNGSTLTINETNGEHLTYDNVNGSLAGYVVTIASDDNGGTDVYWAQIPSPVPPTINGTVAGQTTTSEKPVKPFSAVTIADSNVGATDTLTVTLSGGGTTGALSGGGLAGGTSGVYTLSGTAAAISAELNALSFEPAVGASGSITSTPSSSATSAPALSLRRATIRRL